MTLLTVPPSLRTDNLKGLGATLTVRQRDNDVGRTAPRPLLQHLEPVSKKKMMWVSDRDVRHDPFKNRGTLSCSVNQRSPTPSLSL